MVGGALGIAFVIAKIGVALGATTGVVVGFKYFATYEWQPKGKKTGKYKYEGGSQDNDTDFDNFRSKFRNGY